MISKLTWADYVALVALLRGLYVGYKSGFFHELLRVAGFIVTIIVSVLFYEDVAQAITLNTFLNITFARIAGFCILLVVVFLVTKIVRSILLKLLKVGEGGAVNRILGMALGGARWLMLLSFFFMVVDQSPLKQLQEDVHKRSLTGSTIVQAAPALMEFMGQLSPKLALSKKDA